MDEKTAATDQLTLHYCRYRKKGEPDWYEPQADIRKIFPGVMLAALTAMEDQVHGDGVKLAQLERLHELVRVFQIHLLEDPASLATQLGAFFEATNEVPAHVITVWIKQVFSIMVCIYGFLCRRDAETDSRELRRMIEASRLLPLKNVLTSGTWERVENELKLLGVSVSLLDSRTTTDEDYVECLETGEVFNNVKKTAREYLGRTTGDDWSVLAQLCDQALSTLDIKSRETEIALSLAYPTYKPNALMATETIDGSERQATDPEVSAEPCAVQMDSRSQQDRGTLRPAE